MKTIPHIVGLENQYVKVQPLTLEQKTLALEAFGYALAESGYLYKNENVKKEVIETFVSFLDRGLIL